MAKKPNHIAAVLLVMILVAPPLQASPDSPTPVVFTKSKLAVRTADGQRDLVRSDVHVYDDRIEVLAHGKREVLRTLAYADVNDAQYSYSKSPRWKSGAGAAVAIGVFAIPLFFMKGKKHWLTLQEEGDYLVLKLDKKIFRELIAAFESKSNIQVERLKEE